MKAIEHEGAKSVLLTSSYSVADYERMKAKKDREGIADLIEARFTERYLDPVDNKTAWSERSGFAIMAISCLLVETLESFSRGWPSTDRRSEAAFCSFFDRWDAFKDFRGSAREFYRHVRCGILHQAETTGGWRILRKGDLVNSKRRVVNAAKFVKRLRAVVHTYGKRLRTGKWDGEDWRNLRRKMESVCANAVAHS